MDLKNAKEVVTGFEGRLNAEVIRQEKIDKVENRDFRRENRDFRREELLEKYIAKMLYKWNDEKFEVEYL